MVDDIKPLFGGTGNIQIMTASPVEVHAQVIRIVWEVKSWPVAWLIVMALVVGIVASVLNIVLLLAKAKIL